MSWSKDSWRSRPAAQQPEWPDLSALRDAETRLEALPPLVFAGEVRHLRAQLAKVAGGGAFLLQAGDCAEPFAGAGGVGRTADQIRDKLKIILQMAIALTYGAGVPVVKVGRIAGQYAKPRSCDTERVGDVELPSFRGYIVNDLAFEAEARQPDPARLVAAYQESAATLNLVRAFTKGGFADISQVHTWNQQFVASSPEGERYERIANQIDRALRFMGACGVDLSHQQHLHATDFWTSHEALILPYEEALTRTEEGGTEPYACSAHMLWVGERTRDINGAHVEYLSGIANPIGVKLGPAATPAEVVALCERLDPERTPGRLTLITRLGAARIADLLPPLVEAVADAAHPVVWACDPMHGNTFTSPGGHKTRRFDDILDELTTFFAVHRAAGTWPGGLHVELTGENVTECLGGSDPVDEEALAERYLSACDPRLNARQALDLAFLVADYLTPNL